MTRRTDLRHLPAWPRLLTRQQAADYLQVAPARLDAACPVAPRRLLEKASPQALRWDRAEIDAWLDSLGGGGNPAARTRDQWLEKLDAGDDETPTRPAH